MLRVHPHRVFVEPSVTVERIDGSGPVSTARLRIEGLLCSLCAANVEGRLERVDGVRRASVDLDAGKAEVVYEAERTGPAKLCAAVESAVVLRPVRRLLARLGGQPA